MAERVVPSRRAGVAARRRKAGTVLGAIVLAGATLVIITFSPVFGADAVRVEGAVALTSEEITTLAGVGEGTNVFHLDTGEAVRALEDDPWIADASVVRDLPATIVIRVQERVPVAVALGDVLAADGRVLPGAATAGLPTVETAGTSLEPHDRSAAAAAVGAMEPKIRDRVSSIVVEPDGDLMVAIDGGRDGMTDGGVAVFYGAPGDAEAKAEALEALLEWIRDEGVRIVAADVSVPSAPTARPADGPSTEVP